MENKSTHKCCSHHSSEPTKKIKHIEGMLYVCPMCPEVEETEPKPCPVCGMPLEPKVLSLDSFHEDPTSKKIKLNFFLALGLTLPIVILEMLSHLKINTNSFISLDIQRSLQFLITTVVVMGPARKSIFSLFFTSVKTLKLNMWTLIGLGTGIAYIYSTIGWLFNDAIPNEVKTNGYFPLYFSSTATIITLVLLGQLLEHRAREKTQSAIKGLLTLTPTESLKVIKKGDEYIEEVVPTASLKVDDLVKLKPGNKIPSDGVVHEGSSGVDESFLTGEAIPIKKKVGDHVVAGSVTTQGSFIIRVTKVGKETTLAKIVQLVSDAQKSRPEIQKYADKVAAWFVPIVMSISVVTFFAWNFFNPNELGSAVMSAVAVLIIACPCAIGLATPISIVTAIGRGAKEGLLIRSARTLEIFSKVTHLLVDKTGTLTEGKPTVVSVDCVNEHAKNDELEKIMRVAISLEKNSEHPLANAVISKCKEQGHSPYPTKDFKALPGKGVTSKMELGNTWKNAFIGNEKLVRELVKDKTSLNFLEMTLNKSLKNEEVSITTVFIGQEIATNYQLLGALKITDPIKASTPTALKTLNKLGITVLMATGDAEVTAKSVGKKLTLSEIRAGLTPADKLNWVKDLEASGHLVAMVGDGVNDAPALSVASVGVAMGTGADIAIESADATLTHGDLNSLIKLRELSSLTMRNIKQNLFFAFIYNVVGMVVATGILYPWWGVLLSPTVASVAMSLSSISVISNALRLRQIKGNIKGN